MVVMAKGIKELFSFTLNGIHASVKCVSCMIVVLNAKFALLLAAHTNKRRRSPTRVDFSLRNNFAKVPVHIYNSLDIGDQLTNIKSTRNFIS